MVLPAKPIKYVDAEGQTKIIRLRLDANAIADFDDILRRNTGDATASLMKLLSNIDPETKGSNLGFTDIRLLVYLGVRWDNPRFTLKDAGEVMAVVPLNELMGYMAEFIQDAFTISNPKGESSGEASP